MVELLSLHERKILALLMEKELVHQERIAEAMEKTMPGQRVGEYLIWKGYLDDRVLAAYIAQAQGYPLEELPPGHRPDRKVLSLVSGELAFRERILPLRYQDGVLILGAFDPSLLESKEFLEETVCQSVECCVVPLRQLLAALWEGYPEIRPLIPSWTRELLQRARGIERRSRRLKEKIRPQTNQAPPYIDVDLTPPDPKLLPLLPTDWLQRYKIYPHSLDGDRLILLMADPQNLDIQDTVALFFKTKGYPYRLLPAATDERSLNLLIQEAARTAEGGKEQEGQGTPNEPPAGQGEPPLEGPGLENEQWLFLRQVLKEAYLREASDIHLEPEEARVVLRMRIDGILQDREVVDKRFYQGLVNVIKGQGGMRIDEKRKPQDGRIRMRLDEIQADLRVSVVPTVRGERVVMRLLKEASAVPSLDRIGFLPDTLELLRRIIHRPHGIFLITGPTGSGKSFTTFSILKEIATRERCVLSVEDPVEYEVPNVAQVQVNPRAGLDFADALRAFLRQDPDVIVVGEIRDSETAKVALNAALTGHLVIATLHTNDSAQAVVRLEEMGVERFNIAGALLGVLAQRLVRKVCPACATPVPPLPGVAEEIGFGGEATPRKGTGCRKCSGTGYRGRTAVHELLFVGDEVREAILKGETATGIKRLARTKGLRTLREDALYKALMGITTFEEALGRTAE